MLADAISHVITVILISGSVVLVGAIVLNPQGTKNHSACTVGGAAGAVSWKCGKICHGTCSLGSRIFFLLGNTQRGMVLLNAGFDKEVGLESGSIRWGCVLCLVFALIVCFSYGGSPTQLIFIANVATAIATPVGGLFITMMIWRKDVSCGMKPPRVLQICMTVSYLFALVMTGSSVMKLIG